MHRLANLQDLICMAVHLYVLRAQTSSLHQPHHARQVSFLLQTMFQSHIDPMVLVHKERHTTAQAGIGRRCRCMGYELQVCMATGSATERATGLNYKQPTLATGSTEPASGVGRFCVGSFCSSSQVMPQ
jgi:hypothetical protein